MTSLTQTSLGIDSSLAKIARYSSRGIATKKSFPHLQSASPRAFSGQSEGRSKTP
ncbi:MAG TPA: hypothetical protein PLK35_03930 [Candidatus Moranbacteria bacterium]|nr:hypothetical protein [Candidatus Moranbacteria bacterium]